MPGGPLDENAREMVRLLQADRPDFPTYVVGQASGLQDFTDSMFERAILAFALVALATLVLLFLMTGSVVIPVKALLINVVSLGASLGVLVWVFQQGHLEGLLRFDSVGAHRVDDPAAGPRLRVRALDGLRGLPAVADRRAPRARLQQRRGSRHGPAALRAHHHLGRRCSSSSSSRASWPGQLLVIKQTGVGLAVAVLIDATLVRMLLVPATMSVLGDWNWWAPARLRRLHARFGITE